MKCNSRLRYKSNDATQLIRAYSLSRYVVDTDVCNEQPIEPYRYLHNVK